MAATASSSTRDDRPCRLADLFDFAGKVGHDDRVELGDVMDALAHRSYGPLLLVPALISVMPVIGALPGVTWTTSALCLLVSIQFLLQRNSLWLPGALRNLHFSQSAFEKGVAKAKPWLRRMDGFTHPRLRLMLHPPAPLFIALLCVALSLAMFVFSLVPGGVVIPAAALILIAIGLTTHDGFFIVAGAITGSAAVSATGWLVNRLIEHVG
ncbi:MAG: hypothetical protein CMF74_17985 [Maricaulis sp.]|jgi:hypothetical protein|nr:hypothetical protein [Maricaulis sp.]MAL11538.1 hypothetical protein [Maricaulis sp.]HAQ35775.1 hypothetical protein [Alphaproteobacteria bacterium]|tara:strand:- start:16 stop:648 length:633 start_codon:yes stop_codon:yes gene_type:complete